jgi:Uma2 family endonuclease
MSFVGLELRPVRLTYDDLLALAMDSGRHELLDGDHVVTPSPRPLHQTVVGNLFLALVLHVRERRLGRVFGAPVDVVLSPHDVLVPDLVFVS